MAERARSPKLEQTLARASLRVFELCGIFFGENRPNADAPTKYEHAVEQLW